MLTSIILMGLFILPAKTHAASLDSVPGAVTTSGSRLNIRSIPSTSGAAVGVLNKGSYVTLISKSGSWWYVEYAKGKFGYCHSDYITPVAGSAVSVITQGSNLNVRSGAGTSSPKIAVLTKEETVIELSSSGGWSRILFHGTRTGYVSSRYLSSYRRAVSLNVPSFKQTDERWANVMIGQSGKTMAQIGCATTAVAMMESYRTGTIIYPDAMTKKLTYTPCGSIYWPGNYTTVTSNSGYLNRIHTLLRQGKPVLFGATNAYGKQHWVVIKGFAEGSSLIPSAFSIHDPGSGSRVTLQQFLDAYPNFYKYFHY